jgi:uncharacterized OsmC-like protein
MSTTATPPTATTAPVVRNGVPVTKLFGTIGRLTDEPDLAAFRFTAHNEWVDGTASRSTIHEWHGVGADHVHADEFSFAADHPTLGLGHGPTPQEYVLHALAACLTLGIATIASARGIALRRVAATVTGDIDVRGVLGIDADVRNGFSHIEVAYDVDADASPEEVAALVEASRRRSAVYDMLTGTTPVTVEVA